MRIHRALATALLPACLLLASCGGEDPADNDDPSSTTSPTASQSASPTTEPSETTDPSTGEPPPGLKVVTLKNDLSQGAAPNVGMANHKTNSFRHGFGPSFPISEDYFQVTLIEPLVFGVRGTDSGWVMDALDMNDGALQWSVPIYGQFAVSGDHSVIAWAHPNGEIHTWTAASGDVQMAPQEPESEVTAIVGGTNCKEAEGFSCTVYFHSYSETPANMAKLTTSHGITESVIIGKTIQTTDVAGDGKIALWRRSFDVGTCSTVLSPSYSQLFRTCKHLPAKFSPDSKLLAAYPAYLDGLGSGQFFVLDANTGKVRVRIESSASGFMTAMRWEDKDHLLVTAYDAGKWAAYRVTISTGAVERATAAVAASDVDAVFVLGT